MSDQVYAPNFGLKKIYQTAVLPFDPTTSTKTYNGGAFQKGNIVYSNATATYFGFAGINSSGNAIWVSLGGAAGDFTTMTTDSGVATVSLGNLNIDGASSLISFSGAGDTVTAHTVVGGYPITPFVVGPAGKAGYQTIQSAINACNTAGGGAVYIQGNGVTPYVENLDFSAITNQVELIGVSSSPFVENVIIQGIHVPPISGVFTSFTSIGFESATHIFSSNAVTTCSMTFYKCLFQCTNGYVINTPNYTAGSLYLMYESYNGGANCGMVNCAASTFYMFDCLMSVVSTNASTFASGNIIGSQFYAPFSITASSAGVALLSGSQFAGTVTFASTSSAQVIGCEFISTGVPAITMSSSNAVIITDSSINTNNNPAISGSGAGALTLSNITYLNNASVAGTLTVTATTNHSMLLGRGTGATASLGTATNGQLPIGSTGADPVLAALTAGAGVSITNGAGSITVATTGAASTWTNEATSFAAAANNGYFVTAAATATLPVTAGLANGTEISFVATSGNNLVIQAAASQVIQIGTSASSTAGTQTTDAPQTGSSLTLRFITSTQTWWATSSMGNWSAA